jgi:hypothetical protein
LVRAQSRAKHVVRRAGGAVLVHAMPGAHPPTVLLLLPLLLLLLPLLLRACGCVCVCCCCADLQGLADDMLVRLAPRFGVTLPPELQRLAKEQAEQEAEAAKAAAAAAAASSEGSGTSAFASSSSSQRPQVVFPGGFAAN